MMCCRFIPIRLMVISKVIITICPGKKNKEILFFKSLPIGKQSLPIFYMFCKCSPVLKHFITFCDNNDLILHQTILLLKDDIHTVEPLAAGNPWHTTLRMPFLFGILWAISAATGNEIQRGFVWGTETASQQHSQWHANFRQALSGS